MTSAPTVSSYLMYSSLQMAAEAFLNDPKWGKRYVGTDLSDALIRGNDHVSVFTPTQAANFAAHWQALDQEANTKTGFSGTLFRCTVDDPATGAKVGDLVMSFRSTEFIDDAARDNQATNVQEVKDLGFALGQIRDMEAWYARLKEDGKLKAGDQLAVTGYSLGGHLASAFNMLHGADTDIAIKEVVTFNGAGVGQLANGQTLAQVLQRFTALSQNAGLTQIVFANATVNEIYQRTRAAVEAGGTISTADRATLDGALNPLEPTLLLDASDKLDVRRLQQAYGDKQYDTPGGMAPQYDAVGDTSPSAVANSQWHIGKDVRIPIEDQPLYRRGAMSFRSTECIDDAARDNQATRPRGCLPAFAA